MTSKAAVQFWRAHAARLLEAGYAVKIVARVCGVAERTVHDAIAKGLLPRPWKRCRHCGERILNAVVVKKRLGCSDACARALKRADQKAHRERHLVRERQKAVTRWQRYQASETGRACALERARRRLQSKDQSLVNLCCVVCRGDFRGRAGKSVCRSPQCRKAYGRQVGRSKYYANHEDNLRRYRENYRKPAGQSRIRKSETRWANRVRARLGFEPSLVLWELLRGLRTLTVARHGPYGAGPGRPRGRGGWPKVLRQSC